MLLDAHGGAVAAGGHGLWFMVRYGGGVMGLLLVPGRRGASAGRTVQQAWWSGELWRVRGAVLVCLWRAQLYRRAGRVMFGT